MMRAVVFVLASMILAGCQCDGSSVGQVQGVLEMTPAALDFGDVAVTRSGPAVLTLRNGGDFRLEVSGFASQAPFAVPGEALSLEPGATHALTLTFSPAAEGVATGRLTFLTSDPDAPEVAVDLTGRGVEAQVQVHPELLDFGEVLFEVASPTVFERIAVRNPGTGLFAVTAIESLDDGGGAFELFPGQALRTYAPGEESTFEVAFLPKDLGPVSGTLRVVTDARLTPEIVVPVQGVAVGPAVLVCAALEGAAERCMPGSLSIDFGPVVVGETASGYVDVKNVGTRDLRVSRLHLGGSAADFYTDGLPEAGATVPPQESARFGVHYTPADYGADGAGLSVLSTARKNPGVLVALSGRARRPDIEVLPAGLTMRVDGRDVTHSEQQVRFYNCGDDPLVLQEITLVQDSGPVADVITLAAAPSAGTVVPAQGVGCTTGAATATAVVAFDSAVIGNYTGTLTVLSDDPVDGLVEIDVVVDKR